MEYGAEQLFEAVVHDNDTSIYWKGTPNILNAIVRVHVDGENVQCDRPQPVIVSVNGSTRNKLLRFCPKDPSKKMDFSISTTFIRGKREHGSKFSSAPDLEHVYQLPFSKGKKCRVIQSYMGRTHFDDTNKYAIDFTMPEGEVVTASRGGTVWALRKDSVNGGRNRQFLNAANYIVIRHSDNTYAHYYHLQKDGVLVKTGQKVNTGDPIGYSGMTGFCGGPHLHFSVCKIEDTHEVSIPILLKTSNGVIAHLPDGIICSH